MNMLLKTMIKFTKKALRINDFSSKEELNKYQLKMFKKKIKKAYKKTSYYKRIIDDILNKEKISLNDLLKRIKTIEDINIIPITERSDLQEHGKEMINNKYDLNELIMTHTSGTTTNKPLYFYLSYKKHRINDVIKGGLLLLDIFHKFNIDYNDKISIILPGGSSLNNMNGKIQKIFPNMDFFDLDNITKEDIISILNHDVLHTYTNIPAQLFKKHEDDINEFLNNNGKSNIKIILGAGDFLASGAKKEIKRILRSDNLIIANLYSAIEAQNLTHFCNHFTTHTNSPYLIELRELPIDYYKTRIENIKQIAEENNLTDVVSSLENIKYESLDGIIKELSNIKSNSIINQHISDIITLIKKANNGVVGELIVTNLLFDGMIVLRYAIGDVVELINCDCNEPYPALKMLGRVKGLNKHIEVNSIIDIIYQSKAYKNGWISGKGFIEYEMGELKPIINIYLEKGLKFDDNITKELISNDFFETISKSNDYSLKFGIKKEWSIWDINIKLIDNYEPVKWRVIEK